MANTQREVVLEMFFLTFGNANIRFTEREVVWKTYSTVKALPITQRVEINDKKEFATTKLNKDNETFVMHMAVFNISSNIHLSWQI